MRATELVVYLIASGWIVAYVVAVIRTNRSRRRRAEEVKAAMDEKQRSLDNLEVAVHDYRMTAEEFAERVGDRSRAIDRRQS